MKTKTPKDKKQKQDTRTLQQKVADAIWAALTAIRGKMKTDKIMPYLFGLLFYKYLSENLEITINKSEQEADIGGDKNFNYSSISDKEAEVFKEEILKEKGFFIYPSQLFSKTFKEIRDNKSVGKPNKDLNINLGKLFAEIEKTSVGQSTAENNFKGLLVSSDLNFTSEYLGKTSVEQNEMLTELFLIVGYQMPSISDCKNDDVLGNIYEALMTRFTQGSSTELGEYFTVPSISQLVTRIATIGKKKVKNIYDGTIGSGGLMLQAIRHLGKENIGHIYGQELEPSTYLMCKRNMFLNNINPYSFNIAQGDTINSPAFMDVAEKDGFDLIVANPPYSQPWTDKINKKKGTFLKGLAPKNWKTQERFAAFGGENVSVADWPFDMHFCYCLSDTGTAGIVNPLGVLSREEGKTVRKYLVDNNLLDGVILLSGDLFYTTPIATCILILKGKKAKKDSSVLFIDASEQIKPWAEKVKGDGTKKRYDMYQENINQIVKWYQERKNVKNFVHLATKKEIEKNDYVFTVNAYVNKEIKKEKIDICKISQEIKVIVEQNDVLRSKINSILEEESE